ncbi:hypothetical protein Q8F55_006446 [Vanrija albida]|uniref:BHLH domain-containing protein n=1 Tax=Vanrija albida TaxID=181172 RepID=A0ABR3PX54_9TREE
MSAVLANDLFSFDDNDESVPSSNTLFPPTLSFPGLDALDNAYLSPNSLSPHSSDPSHTLSPPSFGSPNSSLSFATDEYLLNNSFGNDELDLLIFPDENKPDLNLLDSLAMPIPQTGNQGFGSLNVAPQPDIKAPIGHPAAVPAVPMGAIQPPAFDGLLDQWRQSLVQSMNQGQQLPWMVGTGVMPTPIQPAVPNPQPTQAPMPQQAPPPAVALPPQPTPPKEAPKAANPPPRRSAPNAPLTKRSVSPPVNVGKHNKTERRYRQKVQQAQADLRDAVPALRVLYGTSSEEQKQLTDIRAADGTVDGLGEVTRPNASAKATILIGARMYIELLQRRTASLQRKVAELESWRQAVGGPDDLEAWRADFDAREAVLAAQLAAAAALNRSDDSGDDDSEEEEVAPRKRPRVTKKAKAADDKVGQGMKAFAAFAVSFSLMPSASKIFSGTPSHAAGSSSSVAYTGELARTQVISRLPLITAEHGSRLLARALPSAVVPGPHTIVDWTAKLLVAGVLIFILGPVLERVTRKHRDEKTGAGGIAGFVRDAVKAHVGPSVEDVGEWNTLAARIVGGFVKPSILVRWHVAFRLRRSVDPYSLALLALLAPECASSRTAWVEARTRAAPNSPLATVLALPLDEASRCLELVPPTSAPIAAIAEQINLAHLYDLYSRFFVRLVAAVGDATSLSPMLLNVQRSTIAQELKSFDREIRGVLHGVPRHSTSHALGLVLLGLWGLFSGYQSPAVLVSALAAEEVQGAGSSLASVSALLELLYPNSSIPRQTTSAPASPNAQAIDKLALACIGFVDLLYSSSNGSTATRVERLEVSQRVQKEAVRLRLVLTQATFVGLDDDEEDNASEESFDDARQKLVSVLCNVGRRAAGRSVYRDDDSGLEDDVEDW